MMGLRNIFNLINTMRIFCYFFGKISLLDPIIQYSIIPTLQPFELKFIAHPYGVKPKPGSLGQDSLLNHSCSDARLAI
jgi:hypothetical protein